MLFGNTNSAISELIPHTDCSPPSRIVSRLRLLIATAIASSGCGSGEADTVARNAVFDTLYGLGLASQYYHAEFGRWPEGLADLRQQDPNGWMTATIDQVPLDVAFADGQFARADFRVSSDSTLVIEVAYHPFEARQGRYDDPDSYPAEVSELVGSVRARPGIGDSTWVWVDAERATVNSPVGQAKVSAWRDSTETLLLYRAKP